MQQFLKTFNFIMECSYFFIVLEYLNEKKTIKIENMNKNIKNKLHVTDIKKEKWCWKINTKQKLIKAMFIIHLSLSWLFSWASSTAVFVCHIHLSCPVSDCYDTWRRSDLSCSVGSEYRCSCPQVPLRSYGKIWTVWNNHWKVHVQFFFINLLKLFLTMITGKKWPQWTVRKLFT